MLIQLAIITTDSPGESKASDLLVTEVKRPSKVVQ